MKECVICSKENSNYKCPICLKQYCSLICCKLHRSLKCSPSEIVKDNARENIEFLTQDTIPQEKLQLLDGSETLKNLLNNQHLRNFLKDLDSVNDPEKAIHNAMLEPLFVEFADACLQIIEPPNEETKIYNKLETKSSI